MTAPQTARERYAADFLALGVRLPLAISKECPASIVDADGRPFAVIDMNRELPDAEAAKRALWTVLAVNVCGGFPAANPLT